MNVAALLAGLFSGILGAMGLGGGAVLIIYLTLFTDTPQLQAQGINLLFFIPIAVLAVTIYAIKKEIKWKLVLKIAPFGAIGTALGWYAAGKFENGWLSKIFGAVLILLGIWQIFGNKNKNVAESKKECYTKNE